MPQTPVNETRKSKGGRPPKLRGRRQAVAITLPPELVAEVDDRAAREERSRAKMIELLLRAALARPSRGAA
jgi:hypothetical protein